MIGTMRFAILSQPGRCCYLGTCLETDAIERMWTSAKHLKTFGFAFCMFLSHHVSRDAASLLFFTSGPNARKRPKAKKGPVSLTGRQTSLPLVFGTLGINQVLHWRTLNTFCFFVFFSYCISFYSKQSSSASKERGPRPRPLVLQDCFRVDRWSSSGRGRQPGAPAPARPCGSALERRSLERRSLGRKNLVLRRKDSQGVYFTLFERTTPWKDDKKVRGHFVFALRGQHTHTHLGTLEG